MYELHDLTTETAIGPFRTLHETRQTQRKLNLTRWAIWCDLLSKEPRLVDWDDGTAQLMSLGSGLTVIEPAPDKASHANGPH